MSDIIDVSSVAKTYNTSKLRMINDEICVFVNQYGQQTPILIVAICKLDSIEYAALFDTDSSNAYAVEVIREKGEIKYFKDMDTFGRDEEWAVISNFFLENNVYERNRIIKWIWNTKIHSDLGGGIPKKTLERWDKKKYKRLK